MKPQSDAVVLRIYTGEATRFKDKALYKYLIELFRKEGLSGCTVLRAIDGFGKTSHAHTASILRLSTDLPVVVEVVDNRENIDRIKPMLSGVVTEGLITEQTVRVVLYNGKNEG
ncbi:MAG: DUF190 domain-containing protein [Candidatus Nitronauta litoralis]|uniref:DUF190 domain-containing protein n=1 Tax=Candidatus Nitronauta litoralis TaxID=2705533 RepID=A0A7T0G214_9BACT|nr:MAG: DUF190 domain-containing protein [Candidatus Nitronauta litoralis]